MFRDFTYIRPATRIIKKLIYFKHKKKFNIFNICSSQPIKISSVINKLAVISKFSKIRKVPMNKLEVFKTYGSNEKVINYLKIKNKNFLNFNVGLKQTAKWFKSFHRLI